jgi:hypothetical protein
MVRFQIKAKDSHTWDQLKGAIDWVLNSHKDIQIHPQDNGYLVIGELVATDKLQHQLRKLFTGFPLQFKIEADF